MRTIFGTFPVEPIEPVADLSAQLTAAFEAIPIETMTGAGHIEYLHLCEDAGFKGIHVELHVGSRSAVSKITIENFVKLSFNPLWPTIEDQMEKIFSREERERLIKHMRPLYEGGNAIHRAASVFISAFKAPIPELSVGTPW